MDDRMRIQNDQFGIFQLLTSKHLLIIKALDPVIAKAIKFTQ